MSAPKAFVIKKSPRVLEVNDIVASLEEVVAADGYQQVKATMACGDVMYIPHPSNYDYPIGIAPGMELSAKSVVVVNADGSKTKKYFFAEGLDAFDTVADDTDDSF